MQADPGLRMSALSEKLPQDISMKSRNIFLLISVLVLLNQFFGGIGCATARSVDHSLLAQFFGSAVNKGAVDYQRLKEREMILDQYLNLLSEVKTDELDSQERFAFYINAYNSWTIKLILMNYPGVSSIKELGSIFRSPWKKKICRIDGKLISLDAIEHDILRPQFKDPRIHFAVNCASKGCPPLRSGPYNAQNLEQQLNDSTTRFINDSNRNYLKGNELHVSSIFKWYKEDFQPDIFSFFLKYVQGDLEKNLQAVRDTVDIIYLDYDWSLNEK